MIKNSFISYIRQKIETNTNIIILIHLKIDFSEFAGVKPNTRICAIFMFQNTITKYLSPND